MKTLGVNKLHPSNYAVARLKRIDKRSPNNAW